MSNHAEDECPSWPQISLRGLFVANTLIGIFVSILTVLGMGEVSVGLLIMWGVLAIMFIAQVAILKIMMLCWPCPRELNNSVSDPRNKFPPLPREGRGERS